MTTFFTSADLLRAIADHLWQSTIFVVAAAIIAWLTRKAHPRAQIWIWLAASVKFWIPFAVLVALGNWAGRQATGPAALDATRVTPYVVVQTVSEPFSGAVAASAPGTTWPAETAFPWVAILSVLWASGALAISVRWLGRWRRVTRLAAAAHVAVAGREVDALARASVAMGIAARPPIALTDAFIEPGILGATRTTLLWPAGLSEHLDDEQLYAVMLHELSHRRRRDNVMAAAHMVVEAVFWFYPVVWWVGSRLVDARELACDEDVVRLSHSPSAYASSLLKTCRYCLESPLDCVPGITGSELHRRIDNIMRTPLAIELTMWRKALIAGVIAVAIGTPLAAGAVKGPLTNVWRGAVSLPEESGRPAHAPFVFSPRMPSLDDAFRLAASPAKQIDTSPAALSRQSASLADLRFDAASIKPMLSPYEMGRQAGRAAANGTPAPVFPPSLPRVRTGGRFSDEITLKQLIMDAFDLKDYQVIAATDWIASDWFAVNATAGRDATPVELRAMLRSLLRDRFGLRTHEETRQLPVLVLALARSDRRLGSGLKRTSPECAQQVEARKDGTAPPVRPPALSGGRDLPATPICEVVLSHSDVADSRTTMYGGFALTSLVSDISTELSAPVVDRTGLTGLFDITITYTSQRAAAGRRPGLDPNSNDTPAPPLSVALERQLGLKLEKQTGPLPVIVIDAAQHPTPD